MAKTSKKSTPSVTIDQRKKAERRGDERRGGGQPVSVERRSGERRAKVVRRRQIDPTTCERDYSPEEVEFMHALEQYKRANGRMFPTCSEVLEVIRGLGYEKLNRATQHNVDNQPSADPCRCEDSVETLPACSQDQAAAG